MEHLRQKNDCSREYKMLYLETDLPVSWRSLSNEAVTLDPHPSGKWASVPSLQTRSGDNTSSCQAGLDKEFFHQLHITGLGMKGEGERKSAHPGCDTICFKKGIESKTTGTSASLLVIITS